MKQSYRERVSLSAYPFVFSLFFPCLLFHPSCLVFHGSSFVFHERFLILYERFFISPESFLVFHKSFFVFQCSIKASVYSIAVSRSVMEDRWYSMKAKVLLTLGPVALAPVWHGDVQRRVLMQCCFIFEGIGTNSYNICSNPVQIKRNITLEHVFQHLYVIRARGQRGRGSSILLYSNV